MNGINDSNYLEKLFTDEVRGALNKDGNGESGSSEADCGIQIVYGHVIPNSFNDQGRVNCCVTTGRSINSPEWNPPEEPSVLNHKPVLLMWEGAFPPFWGGESYETVYPEAKPPSDYGFAYYGYVGPLVCEYPYDEDDGTWNVYFDCSRLKYGNDDMSFPDDVGKLWCDFDVVEYEGQYRSLWSFV